MRYPGGKAKVFHHIINLLPQHSVYIEPFLGGAAVLRAKSPSDIEIAVDRELGVLNDPELKARGVRLIHGDGIEFLENYSFEGHEVVYCDPPYLPQTRKRSRVYKHDLSTADHGRLLEVIGHINAKVIVSGYQSSLYSSALAMWNMKTFKAKAHDGCREEVLWFNYQLPSVLHDYHCLGSNFRERQTIKRRLARLTRRISCLSDQERAYLREWLSQEDGSDAA